MTPALAPDLAPLISALPEGAVITDPNSMDGYRWDRALDPDAGVPLAVVRAQSTEDVQAAVLFAAEHGLWYPPDPSSYEFCSIGGNVATNAGPGCPTTSATRSWDSTAR